MESLDINRIAIIGAGPAGICAARHLYHNKYNDKKFDIVVYEKQDQVGGLWIYNKWDKQKEEKDISPMYKDLISNAPALSMYYPDFPLPDNTEAFPSSKVVLEYLQNYAKHFNVEKFIKFETEVTIVSPLIEEDKSVSENGPDRFIKWKVESKDLKTERKHSEEFDAVIMCNGIHSKPNIPTIDGINNFKGKILHSKFYDDPADFQNKVVVVYGYGSSAIDIVATVCHTCTKLIIASHSKSIFDGNHPNNVFVFPGILKISKNGEIVFIDRQSVNADILVFCTGYVYDYPLSPECKVEIQEKRKAVTPFYLHLFHAIYPSLSIMSLAYALPTFATMHLQCAYLTSIYTGCKQLPSQTEMLNFIADEKAKHQADGKPLKYFHTFGPNAIALNDKLSNLLGEEKIPSLIHDAYLAAIKYASTDFYSYKEKIMEVLN